MTPHLSPEGFVAIGAAAAPGFSRDGRGLFFLGGSSLAQIWRLDLDDGSTRQLTSHEERVAFLRRAPQDDRIVYGIDAGGDERQQLWLLQEGASTALTAAPDVIHEFGAWSPDGTRIAYTANDRDEAHFDVLVMDVATREARRLLHGTHAMSVAGWSPTGDRLVAIADRGFGEQTLWVIPISGASEARAVPTPALTRWAQVRWSADGAALLGLTDLGGLDFLRLGRIAPETGFVTWLYSAPGRDVEAWALSPDGGRLATIENAGGAAVLRVGDLADDRPAVPGLPDGGGASGMVADPAWSAAGDALAFVASSPIDPPGLFVLDCASGAVRPVWRPDPLAEGGIDPARFRGFSAVAWESFDGRRIPGWLALPDAPPPSGAPAVIWVHGGPAAQTRAGFRVDMQFLLAHGYAVLMPNVRGSTGYGRAYAESDDGARRPDAVADLLHARQYLAGLPAIDAARIAVMGQSYGGYMVLAALIEAPDLWCAGIDYYGIADFATLLARTGPWRRSHRAAEYGDAAADAALFARISPVHHAERIRAPLLVLHGARDPRVPIGESEQIVDSLRRLRRPVRYVRFDYAGHGFARAQDRVRALAEVIAILEEPCQAAAEPAHEVRI